jgi:hypothetical protein
MSTEPRDSNALGNYYYFVVLTTFYQAITTGKGPFSPFLFLPVLTRPLPEK